MLNVRIDILQDPNSPQMKVWALVTTGEHGRLMYGGVTGKSRRIGTAVTAKDGFARLTGKERKYPLSWKRTIMIDDQVHNTLQDALESILTEVFEEFERWGGASSGIEPLLHRLSQGVAPAPKPADHSKLNAALKSIQTASPWAF